MKEESIWSCKIGGTGCDLPGGADNQMRDAVADAFREVTGVEAQFIFSGWGEELTEEERAALEDREPSAEHYAQWKLQQAAPDLLEALKGVVRVADRATIEFDAARAAIAKATGESTERKS